MIKSLWIVHHIVQLFLWLYFRENFVFIIVMIK